MGLHNARNTKKCTLSSTNFLKCAVLTTTVHHFDKLCHCIMAIYLHWLMFYNTMKGKLIWFDWKFIFGIAEVDFISSTLGYYINGVGKKWFLIQALLLEINENINTQLTPVTKT